LPPQKGSLLEAESRLHHSFVVGPDWEGKACTAWRLGVSFAGQGQGSGQGPGQGASDGGRGRGRDGDDDASGVHGADAAGAAEVKQPPQAGRAEGPGGGREALFQPGSQPVLETQGPVSLGPCTAEAARMAVEDSLVCGVSSAVLVSRCTNTALAVAN